MPSQNLLTITVNRNSPTEPNFLGAGKNVKPTWEKLVSMIQSPTRQEITLEEYKALHEEGKTDLQAASRAKALKGGGGWLVGGRINAKKPQRGAATIDNVCLLSLDYDELTPAQAEAILTGQNSLAAYCYIAYTTWSSTVEKPRVRVLVPLSEPISMKPVGLFRPGRAMYDESNLAAQRLLCPEVKADGCSESYAQLMFLPNYASDGDERIYVNHGKTPRAQDLQTVADATSGGSFKDWKEAHKVSTRVGNGKLLAPPTERGGYIGAFCEDWSIGEVIDTFFPDLYFRASEGKWKWTKGTGLPGAQLVGGWWLHVHDTGTHPAPKQNLNAFDLVRIHKFGHLDEEAKVDVRLGNRDAPSFQATVEWIKSGDNAINKLITKRVKTEARERFAEEKKIALMSHFEDADASLGSLEPPAAPAAAPVSAPISAPVKPTPEKEVDEPENPEEISASDIVDQFEDLGEEEEGPVSAPMKKPELGTGGGEYPEGTQKDRFPVDMLIGEKKPTVPRTWVEQLMTNKDGAILTCDFNLNLIFENDSRFNSHFGEDLSNPRVGRSVIRDVKTKDGVVVYAKGMTVSSVVSASPGAQCVAELRVLVNSTYGTNFSNGHCMEQVGKISRGYRFHPKVEKLANMVWDGVPRLDTAAARWFGDESRVALYAYRETLIAMIARTFNPGHAYPYMPILTGHQGSGKGQSFGVYAEILDGKPHYSLEGKIGDEKLARKLLRPSVVEDEECNLMRSSDIESYKKFVSSSSDVLDIKYDPDSFDTMRGFIAYATTNVSDFLKERENRRFPTIKVRENQGDTKELRFDRYAYRKEAEQILAEALVVYLDRVEEAGDYKAVNLLYPREVMEEMTAAQEEFTYQGDCGMFLEYVEELMDKVMEREDGTKFQTTRTRYKDILDRVISDQTNLIWPKQVQMKPAKFKSYLQRGLRDEGGPLGRLWESTNISVRFGGHKSKTIDRRGCSLEEKEARERTARQGNNGTVLHEVHIDQVEQDEEVMF